MRKLLALVAGVALGSSAFGAYSFDDITGATWTNYFVPEGTTATEGPFTAAAENTTLANLNPVTAIEFMVYNPSAVAVTGATLNLEVLDATGTNPAGSPGNVIISQALSLPSLAGQTIVDITVPISFTPTSTNVWTGFWFSNTTIGAVINSNAPSIGSANPTDFALDLTTGGWNGAYQLTNSSGGVLAPYFGIRYTATPAPEPASLAVLGIGIAGLIARKRRSGA